MRNLRGTLAVAALLLALGQAGIAQSGNDLFQKALSKERAEGQIEEAIKLYERVVIDFASDRALVAKALVQMGRCHERLGSAEARKAYERVVREYADQSVLAADARARLTALERVPGAPAGPTARRIWAGGDVDLAGAPSPDGRYLTFVDWETGGDLAIRDLATGAKRRLTSSARPAGPTGFANASAPSPDGRHIAYTWFNNDVDAFELRVIGSDGKSPRVVYSRPNEYVLQVAWMPDGAHCAIAFERADRTHQIAIISVADGSLRPLRTFDWRTVAQLGVSPDGRHIVYDFPPQEDAPARDVYILASDGGGAGPLVEHAANDLFPLWTPDGRSVLFVSDRTGTPALWSMPVAGGRAAGSPRQVQPVGNIVPLGFTRAGALYYGLQTSTIDVYIAALDPTSGKLATSPKLAARRIMGSNQRADWSFDGRFLAYQSDRVPGGGMGSRVLSILSLETGVERDLSPALPYFQRPRWSPDGRSLLVSGHAPAGRHGLHAIDAESGKISTLVLVDPDVSAFGHTWSPDGSTVFFTTDDARGSFIAARDLKSGIQRELYRPPAGGAGDSAVSPDGRWVAFRRANGPDTIAIVPVTGGTTRDVVRVSEPDIIPAFGGINWTPDGRFLFFVRGGGPMNNNRELWRVPVEGGEPQKVGLSMRGLRDVRLHPDGRQLAFTAGEGSDEVWVLENLTFTPVSDSPSTRGKR